MSVAPEVPREEYLGDDSTDTYTYHFEVSKPEELHVYLEDDEGQVTRLMPGTDFMVLGIDESGLDIDPMVGDDDGGPTGIGDIDGGKIKLLAGNLQTDFKLIILRILDLEQPVPFRENKSYFAKIHEQSFDRSIKIDQQQQLQIERGIRFGPTTNPSTFNTEMPTPKPGMVVVVNDSATGMELKSFSELSSEAGSGLPPGGDEFDVLERGATEGEGRWVPLIYRGFSGRYSQLVDLVGPKAIFDFIMDMGYSAPTVAFSATGSGALRERGDSVTSVDLALSFTKVSEDIEQVRFYYDGVLIHTDNTLNPAADSVAHTWTGSFGTNKTFQAQVDDALNAPAVTRNITFSFVYPYYRGVGAAGLGSGVSALTKEIIASNANLTRTFTPNGSQKLYFAYPASYGALTAIFDVNNFNTIADWTLTTTNITGLDGSPVSYRIYEFNNFAVAGSYDYRFVR